MSAQHLVLIGYRGTGKTSVAKRLAQRLDRPWTDADDALEQVAGESITELFLRDGEEVFRDLESVILQQLVESEPQILALGGGVVGREANRKRIATAGHVVWLRAAAETIDGRLNGDPQRATQRPNLTTRGGLPEIIELLTQREPLYRECSDVMVDTEDKTIDSIVDEILTQWPDS